VDGPPRMLAGPFRISARAASAAFALVLLAAGAAYTGVCAWKLYEKKQRRRRTALAVLTYLFVFDLTARLLPASAWIAVREHVQSIGSLSRLRGPLR